MALRGAQLGTAANLEWYNSTKPTASPNPSSEVELGYVMLDVKAYACLWSPINTSVVPVCDPRPDVAGGLVSGVQPAIEEMARQGGSSRSNIIFEFSRSISGKCLAVKERLFSVDCRI